MKYEKGTSTETSFLRIFAKKLRINKIFFVLKISLNIRNTKHENINFPLCIKIYTYFFQHCGQIFVLCQIFFKCDHMVNIFSQIFVGRYLMKQKWEK